MSGEEVMEKLAALVKRVDQREFLDESVVSGLLDEIVAQQPARRGGTDDSHTRSLLGYLRARVSYWNGDLATAIEHYTDSAEASAEVGDVARQAVAMGELALCHEVAGRPAESTRVISDARGLARALDDDWTSARVHYSHGGLLLQQFAYTEALEMFDTAIEHAAAADDDVLGCFGGSAVGLCHAHMGRYKESVTQLEATLEMCRERKMASAEAYATGFLVFSLHKLGRFEEAIETSAASFHTLADLPAANVAVHFVCVAEVYLDVGDLDRAEELLDEVGGMADAADVRAHLVEFHRVRGRLRAARGAFEAAYEDMTEVANLREEAAKQSRARMQVIHNHYNAGLEERNAELAASNKRKQEILETVAHDLRSPIAAVKNFAANLRRSGMGSVTGTDPAAGAGTNDRPDEIEAILLLADELGETVDELLDPIQAAASFESIDLRQIVEQVIRRHAGTLKRRAITMERSISQGTSVTGNPGKIRRVLDNVVSNAVKFSNNDTTVVVNVEREAEAVVIEIVDQGRGLDEEQLTNIFARAGAVRPEDEASIGLGLYSSRQMIEEMGGEISLTSAGPGRGATARLRLPAAV